MWINLQARVNPIATIDTMFVATYDILAFLNPSLLLKAKNFILNGIYNLVPMLTVRVVMHHLLFKVSSACSFDYTINTDRCPLYAREHDHDACTDTQFQ